MVREQLFERQAPPAGMPGVQRRLDARPRRRPVDRLQGMVEGDETMAHDDRFGQQLGNVGIALEPGEGLIDQAAQRRLPQARHRRIDRCQAIGGRSLCVAVKQPVLRMHHLDAARRRADLPVARDAPALTELPPLILTEVEQPHRHRPGAVVDGDHEGAATPETDLRALNPAARERSAAGAQVFDCVDSGTVLVSQGKMEQQIEHRLDPECCELRRDPRSHAAKLRHRRRFEGRCAGGLSQAGGSGCRAGPHVSPVPGCERGSDGIGPDSADLRRRLLHASRCHSFAVAARVTRSSVTITSASLPPRSHLARKQTADRTRLAQTLLTRTPSISTTASLGREAIPTAARAG